MTLRPAAIALVALPGRRWLAVTRPGGGELALPGGHIEDGETPERAAAREVAEETGVQILSSAPLGAGLQDGRVVHVVVAGRTRGAPASIELDAQGGGRVAAPTWSALRAGARQFGAMLDDIEAAYRRAYGRAP